MFLFLFKKIKKNKSDVLRTFGKAFLERENFVLNLGKLDLKVLLLNLKIWFKNFVIKVRIEAKSLSLKTMFLNQVCSLRTNNVNENKI